MEESVLKLRYDGPNPLVAETRAVSGSSPTIPVPRDSQAWPACDNHLINAQLENLPSELRRQLLSILELDELRAIVHASPTFHREYLQDQRYLLCKCLEKTLDSVNVDACAVYRSYNRPSSETVEQFLESYQHRRSSAQYSILTESLTLCETQNMVAFHYSIITPLARRYVSCTLANLAHETKNSQIVEQLSRTEETRVLRALYRFELCCNLYGVGRFGKPRRQWESQVVGSLMLFICLYEPWEVEEIACVYAFAKEEYDKIFCDIRWDVNEKNIKFNSQHRETPEVAYDLYDSWVTDVLLTGTISCGLELLHFVLFKIRDHEHLVSTMQQRMTWPSRSFLEDTLSHVAQFERRHRLWSNRDQKEKQRDAMPFEGDVEPDANGPHPPLAWTLMWGGTYSNLYGFYVEDVIRRWGYVMWDAARVERTGAEDVLARQLEARYGDRDPRDHLPFGPALFKW